MKGNAPERWNMPPATVPARFSIWAFVVYSLIQGAGIVIGGTVRWSAPSFTYLRDAPGAPASWGWALMAFGMALGLASLLPSWWLKAASLLCIVIWSLLFASGAQYAASTIPTAATTGAPVYTLVALLAAILVAPDEARKAT